MLGEMVPNRGTSVPSLLRQVSLAGELQKLARQGGPCAARRVAKLLSRGAPPNAKTRCDLRNRSDTPVTTELSALQLSCVRGHFDVATVLLDARADANLRTGHGETPLHLAVCAPTRHVRRLLCSILLCHGADPNAVDVTHGHTALQAAEMRHGQRSRLACFLRNLPDSRQLHDEIHSHMPAFAPSARRGFRSAPVGLSQRELTTLRSQCLAVQVQHDVQAVTGEAEFRALAHNQECSICLDVLTEKAAQETVEIWQLPCAGHHKFHAACVRTWLSRSGICPSCRGLVRLR